VNEERLQGTDPVGVHSLDHFALTVPDLDEARRFFEAFGLEAKEEEGTLDLHTFGSPHMWARLQNGPSKRLYYLSFAAYAEDLSHFEERLDKLGVRRVDGPDGALDHCGIWFQDLNGIPVQIRAGCKKTPDAKNAAPPVAGSAAIRSAPLRGSQPPVRPSRLSHILLLVPDVPAAVAFYETTLGLRLSDKSSDVVAFTHAMHGSDHHLIAFAKSSGTGLHHSSWDVPTIDDVGRGAGQMQAAGYERGWGVGRHVLGSNYFYYARDPWGSYAEYSFDIDYIPKGMDWEPTSPPEDNSFYLWGPNPPEDFTINYEACS
jgi:catechol 2,3-dioxygenase